MHKNIEVHTYFYLTSAEDCSSNKLPGIDSTSTNKVQLFLCSFWKQLQLESPTCYSKYLTKYVTASVSLTALRCNAALVAYFIYTYTWNSKLA